VRPTPVAMATKFGLGAEIQWPTGLSVCQSVCHKLQITSFFSSGRNRAIFWPSVLHDPSTKRCSSIFDLGPLTPKKLLPKIAFGHNFVTS